MSAESSGSRTGEALCCVNCGKPIRRWDLTMQGPAGPFVHEDSKTRRCWLGDDFQAQAPLNTTEAGRG